MADLSSLVSRVAELARSLPASERYSREEHAGVRLSTMQSVASDLEALVAKPGHDLAGSLKEMVADLRIPERYSREDHADVRDATYRTAADLISEIIPGDM